MSYELILLRHGKSDWDANETDFNRPLTDRGKRGAQRIGVWLAQQGLKPDLVISSPAERAKVTAQKMLKAMGESDADIVYDSRVYDASLDDLLELLTGISEDEKIVILVGHNPDLEELLDYLCKQEIPLTEDGKLLTTATIAHLSLSSKWQDIKQNCAELVEIRRPKSLPKKFPYPGFDDNKEQRIRPAYYYTQSSVIPYRLNKGKLEILLVLSSQKKHHVVPKGIKEPGLSPQESAAKEALEEAGVKGIVAVDPIAVYHYEKWKAMCEVSVYPLQVTQMIDEKHWQEKHRGREWFSPREAAEKLFQPALKTMALDLKKHLNSR